MTEATTVLAPGATIGILGGGQLGRMMAQAAQRMGYRVAVFCPEAEAPACQVTDRHVQGAYDDPAALARLAAEADVVTYEFENVPFVAAETLAQHCPVRPSPEVLKICRNRLREKQFLRDRDIPTAPFRAVPAPERLAEAVKALGLPAVLKTAELGYDGKGQATLRSADDLSAAWRQASGHDGAHDCVLEGYVDFRFEASVLVARSLAGAIETFPIGLNRHRDHILAETAVPAPLSISAAAEAQRIARRIAEGIDLVGLLAVELFVTKEEQILVNELAPRPHNSGHWTIEGCVTSQFEQAIRAIAGLPLGSVARLADATMENLLGDDVLRWSEILQDPNAKLHLYGKAEARPGRKMGHVTRLKPPKS